MQTPWEWQSVSLPVGIMVVPQTPSNPTMLAGTSTKVAPLPWRNDYWDGKFGLVEAIGAGSSVVNQGQTVTATGDGGFPVLHVQDPRRPHGPTAITGVTDNPRTVKIRYKLVQSDGAQ